MKQLIKLMINCAATCICVSAFGYSNPIEGGTTEFVTDQWDVSVPWLYVGSNSSSNMLYVSNGGQVNNQIGVMGNTSSSSGNIGFVSGSNAVWNSALELSVGNLGSDNTLGIFSGGRVNTANAYIGNASSNNFVGISGAGSELSANTLHVGHTGADNSMGILDGGTVSSEQASLGHWIGSDDNSVLVMGTNSLWNNTGSLNIGEHGSENSLIIMDDGAVQSPVVNLGVHSYSSNNTLSVFGENAHLDASELNIGGTATAAGGIGNRVSVSDGGTIVTTDLTIHDGNSLDVNDGGTFSINTNFNLVVSGVNFNEGGTLEVGGRLNGISDAIDGRRTVVLSGEDAVWNATLEQFPPNPTARLSVGKDTAGNALVLRDGATATAFNVEVGGSAGSSNNVLQILGPSVFENVAEWRVGDQGSNNEVTLADGGRLEATTMYVGAEQAAAGNVLTVLGTNSMAQISYEMYVGYRGSNNRMDVLDGGTAEALAMNVGGEYGASNNVLTVSGAGSSVESTWLSVGGYQSQGGDGNHMLISEGGRVENEKGSIGRTAGADDNSVLVTGNGSAWNNSEGLYLGGYRSGANWIDGGTGNSLTVKDGGLVLVGDVNTNNLSIIGSGGGIVVGDASGTPEMILANGSVVESMHGYIGLGANESGSVVVAGSGSVWSNSGSLVVGLYGSDNAMTIADGGLVQSASSSIGGLDNANGNQVVVTDSGSRWDAGWLDVGIGGFGNALIITNGGAVTSERGSVGRGGNGNTAIVTGADSVWTNNHFLIVGDDGSDNELHILDGATVQSAFVGITSPGLNQSLPAGSNNMVRVSGPGSTLVVAGETPYGGTADGILEVGNGLLRIENGGAVHSAVAGIGGKVIVDGSGSVWSNSSNASIVDLTVSDGGAAFAGSAGTVGSITIEGAGSEWVIANDLELEGSLEVRDGGRISSEVATLDAGGFALVTGEDSVWDAGGIRFYGSDSSLVITNGGQVSGGALIGYYWDQDGNSATVTGTNSVWNTQTMRVGGYGSDNTMQILDGATVYSTVGAVASSLGDGEIFTGTNNSVRVSGAGSTWDLLGDHALDDGWLDVGVGTLLIDNGGAVLTDTSNVNGLGAGGVGEVVVEGVGSVWSNATHLIMRRGSATVLDGGRIDASAMSIMYGSSAAVTGLGSSLNVDGVLAVGDDGSGNTLEILDGGAVYSDEGYIGYWKDSAYRNLVVVSGEGSVWQNDKGLYLGGHYEGADWINAGTGNSLTVEDGGRVLVGEVDTNNLPNIGTGGGILIGDASGTPEMIVANGSMVESSHGYIGLGANESGSVVVSGAGSVWSNTVNGTPSYTFSNPVNSASLYDDPVVGPQGALSVGYEGSGNSLVIMNGGRVESSVGYIGHSEMATDNSVVVSGADSVWENRGPLSAGYNGSGNSLQIEDGGAVIAQSGMSIGYGEGADGNQVVVSGEGSSLRSGWYSFGTLPPGIIDGPYLTNLPPTNVLPPYTTFAGEGGVISGSGELTIGNAGSGNTLTVSDGSFAGGNSYIGGAISNNSVSVSNGGSIWSNTTGLVITEGTFTGGEGGVVSNVVITPPVIQPNPVLIMNRLGELSVGRGGSGNSLLIEDGAQVYSMGGVIGQYSNAWNNAVSVIGTNSAWHSQYDLSVGGQMVDYIEGWNTLESQIESAWFDGGRGNSLYVGDGGLVTVGRDLQNRNYSSINVDPGAVINVASNYYQDATSSLRFGVETNAAGAPVNALVNVGGTAEFEEGARIEYASNVGQLQFETFYTNKIIAADKLIVAGIEDADSLDLEMLDASGTLVDVIFWENDADIYGLVGRRHLADSAGFSSNSMMAALSAEIDDMSLLGDSGANRMVNLLNTMSGSQQAAQLEQQYSRGTPNYLHSQSMTEGMKEIKKQTAHKQAVRAAAPEGAGGPYRVDQELQAWVKPYGAWGKRSAQNGYQGYDHNIYGTIVGFDKPLGTALLGLAGGYGRSVINQDDGDYSEARTGYGVVYLNWGKQDWFSDVNMGFGRSKVSQQSGTAFANKADFDASNFAVYYGGGKEIRFKDGLFILTPKGSILWSYYYQTGYTEESSMGVEREVAMYERNSFLSSLGTAFAVQKEYDIMVLKPEARLYWLHEFNSDEESLDYQLVNGPGTEYNFLMPAPESDVLEAGLGISCMFHEELQLGLDVDWRFGKDYSAYAVSGRMMFEF